MVLGSVGRGVLTMLETLHQAGLLTVIWRSQKANNSQWCLDWYAAKLHGGSVIDLKGPASGNSHVHRGGDWRSGGGVGRFTVRTWGNYSYSSGYDIGFRIALVPSP
jgi:hypothetical protein